MIWKRTYVGKGKIKGFLFGGRRGETTVWYTGGAGGTLREPSDGLKLIIQGKGDQLSACLGKK